MLKDQMKRLGQSAGDFWVAKAYPVVLLSLILCMAHASGNGAIPVIGGVIAMILGLLYFLKYVKLQANNGK